MQIGWGGHKIKKYGGPLGDTEARDNVDIEAPVNRRERRAAESFKRKQAKKKK